MADKEFKPGISLAGAVDLTALQHQVKAEPGQAGGAPAAGGYVIDVSETNFESVVQSSATFPIVMLMWVPTDDRLFPMAQALGDAVNSMNGQLQLARVDVAKNPARTASCSSRASMWPRIRRSPRPSACRAHRRCSR